ncbi:hypothetical protein KHW15_00965 [Pseudomonas syringae]|uniref:hypothetical protein n=1 Tax=Pseudomonas syringae TaxID=317 RepID=UPI001BCC1B6F|nr:hypothetical protein [Pseudomonas syringae]MCF5648814.1 hypothetical protein [Pseudomonas syringae]QVI80717.1 hypothetical protein KHW15_00965 [Pseudomonas syringae]
MTQDYVYRIDYTANLRAIPDNCHRARRWDGGPKSYPHKELRSQLNQSSDAQAIYRICFWAKLADAIKDRANYDGHTTLARCLKADVMAAGFSQSWDDGLNPGQAYLFWIVEQLHESNHAFSQASIPFSSFEAVVDGTWLPLSTHLSPPAQVVPKRHEVEEVVKPGLLDRIKGALKGN